MKLKDIQYSTISDENVKTLQKYVKKVASGVKRNILAVDIGTASGKSAISMAMAVDNIIVLTVDPRKECEVNLIRNYKMLDVDSDKITFYDDTSEEFGKDWCPEEIDICFIDGLHTYHGVVCDIENVVSKVKKGGYVMFHDYNLYKNSVGKAIDEFEGKLYKKVEEADGGENEGKKTGSIYVARRI